MGLNSSVPENEKIYIEMCKKAVPLQERWTPKIGDENMVNGEVEKIKSKNLKDVSELMDKIKDIQNTTEISESDLPEVITRKVEDHMRTNLELGIIQAYIAYSDYEVPFCVWIRGFLKDVMET